MTTADQAHMARAIDLARGSLGLTGDNPAVGCVVLDASGEVVGEGATGEGGRPHAEEIALRAAGERARGGTAYVTLEPCAERSAGGPSCSELLVAAGVLRVVVACTDASRFAAGGGPERLRQAGVTHEAGLLGETAAALYATYRPVGNHDRAE